MGLAIAKKIIEDHGGKLDVNSKIRRGTVFYFTLPLYREERDAAQITGH
ncbi:MAG: ATP-binding protein [Calditrichia bacterium]